MDISEGKVGVVENLKKSRSKVTNGGNGKVGEDELRGKRKRKGKKEVCLSSFEPKVKRGRSSFNGVGSSLTRSDGSMLGQSFNGIPFNWDGTGNVIQIPRKRRGYVGRKSQVSRWSGLFSSVNGGVDAKRSSLELAKFEREEVTLVVDIGGGDDEFTARKGKSNQRSKKRRKGLVFGGLSMTNEAEIEVEKTKRVFSGYLDDEDNLEENAAMMLSSRFDPRCTAQTSKSNASSIHSEKGIGSQNGIASPTSGSASRVLRPRNDCKEKGTTEKRRQFYEVVYKDECAQWFLNQRIKVFWPLDERWYFGLVNDYDKETKRHYIKYDDRDMEWTSLQNERFKLLLLPSEVTDVKKSKEAFMNDRPTDTAQKDLKMTDSDTDISSNTDSEPIGSWLARSAHRSKISSLLKKRNRAHLSPSDVPPSSNKVVDLCENDAGVFLEKRAHKMCSFTSTDRLADVGKDAKSVLGGSTSSKDDKSRVVYVRRRFRNKKGRSCCVSLNKNVHTYGFQPLFDCTDPDQMLWSIDSDGMLKLNMALIQYKVFKVQLSLQAHSFWDCTFGAESFRLFRLSLLPGYGTIVNTWPKVNLEVIFVDNFVGLRFFHFEGCLKQAVAFIILILSLFHVPNNPGMHIDMEMPVTSVRLKLSCVQDLRKQHDFALFSFSKLKYSNWLYLDSVLEQHCSFSKQLPLRQCTLDNIKALEGGSKHMSWKPSFKGSRSKSFQSTLPVGLSTCCNDNMRRSPNGKYGMLVPFALSFSAAPTLFFSLHLQLLMETSVACISLPEPVPDSLVECFSEDAALVNLKKPLGASLAGGACSKPQLGTEPTTVCMDFASSGGADTLTCSGDSGSTETDVIHRSQILQHNNPEFERPVTLAQPPTLKDIALKDIASQAISGASDESIMNGLSVEIPMSDIGESRVGGKSVGIPRTADFYWDTNDGIICSPNPIGPKSFWPSKGTNLSSSPLGDMFHGLPNGITDRMRSGFISGPKRPRTRVQYAIPVDGSIFSPKNKAHNQNGRPYGRIRRAGVNKTTDASRGSLRSLELLSCDANLLITVGDRGWRECGARVVLELCNHNEWKLAVKFFGSTKYSHKVQQDLQPGSTNRYTHAMMWKGGKDWALEFPDRSQWMLFKEMHGECFDRNIRAASVKNIPIPGVSLIKGSQDSSVECQYTRSSLYFRQIETDVDMAMNPSKTLYDMDSEDEQWISENGKYFQTQESTCNIIDKLFEKIMDMFEKVSHIQQRDHFNIDELEKFMDGIAPMQVAKAIYQHWQQKRQKVGMPLIRQLQRPSWERYQQQMREWDKAMTKANTVRAHGGQAKLPPKPEMFAFCLMPRGLELLNKGFKHRSHRRFSVLSGHNNTNFGDQDGLRAFGRRLNLSTFEEEKAAFPGNNLEYSDKSLMLHASTGMYSPRDAAGRGFFSLNRDASERNIRPKHHTKSKRIATFLPSSNLHKVPSSSISKKNGVHHWNVSPVWPTPNHQNSDMFLRRSFEQLSGQDLEEFRLRDASGAAKHACNIARLKRERARKLFSRADMIMHKAVFALMTADAVKASCEDPYNCQRQDEERMSE